MCCFEPSLKKETDPLLSPYIKPFLSCICLIRHKQIFQDFYFCTSCHVRQEKLISDPEGHDIVDAS